MVHVQLEKPSLKAFASLRVGELRDEFLTLTNGKQYTFTTPAAWRAAWELRPLHRPVLACPPSSQARYRIPDWED